jgi:NADH:ubiquinone reductase (non-electrogenic)
MAWGARNLISTQVARPFQFLNLGILAYVGDSKALAQVSLGDSTRPCLCQYHCVDRAGRLTVDFHTVKDTGRRAFALWRSVYLAKQVSLRNRVLVAGDWVRDRVFGRDITRF